MFVCVCSYMSVGTHVEVRGQLSRVRRHLPSYGKVSLTDLPLLLFFAELALSFRGNFPKSASHLTSREHLFHRNLPGFLFFKCGVWGSKCLATQASVASALSTEPIPKAKVYYICILAK